MTINMVGVGMFSIIKWQWCSSGSLESLDPRTGEKIQAVCDRKKYNFLNSNDASYYVNQLQQNKP